MNFKFSLILKRLLRNEIYLSFMLFSFFSLGGCAAVDKIGAAAPINMSTLNVYSDNSFTYFFDPVGRYHDKGYFSNEDKDQVIALAFDHKAYNLKDLEWIEIEGPKKIEEKSKWISTQNGPKVSHHVKNLVRIKLKSGANFEGFSVSDELFLGGMMEDHDQVLWLVCNRDKKCKSAALVPAEDQSFNASDLLKTTPLVERPVMDPNSSTSQTLEYYQIRHPIGLFYIAGTATQVDKVPDDFDANNLSAYRKIQLEKENEMKRQADAKKARQAELKESERKLYEFRKHMRVGTRTNCGIVTQIIDDAGDVRVEIGSSSLVLNKWTLFEQGVGFGCYQQRN